MADVGPSVSDSCSVTLGTAEEYVWLGVGCGTAPGPAERGRSDSEPMAAVLPAVSADLPRYRCAQPSTG
ncbi:hypothetical protein ACFFX0_05595 [Citricoccus parietis]|uniref:Uncharacterized protein n=1 Tax=Citricoccus parietis TaxID=592307 RepID=A0ABV5FWP2_9MICC